MANALAQIQATYQTFSDNYAVLLAAASTPQDRDRLKAQYEQAQSIADQTANRYFEDEDPAVADLAHQLAAANQQMEFAAASRSDPRQLMDAIDRALALGSQLLAKFEGLGPGH